MGKIYLYTGGCRSGKSGLATDKAMDLSESVCFVATCVPQDDEMRRRVEKHVEERPAGWCVIEEAVDVSGAISRVDKDKHEVVLVDCLTLWVCNLMCVEDDPLSTEEKMTELAEGLVKAAKEYGGDVIFVTNEVGAGIMPENKMARNYIDLAGRCNQVIASAADTVVLASCGIGVTIKGSMAVTKKD